MANDYMEFGFGAGDENMGGGKFERFKAKEGEFYRASFVWWPTNEELLATKNAALAKKNKPAMEPDFTPADKNKLNFTDTPRFTGAKRFYIQNVGYVLDRGPEFAKIAGQPSKLTIATVIALWPVDRKGLLDKARFASGDVDVLPWVFSNDKYEQLSRRHAEFPFGQFDLNIACTDTTYQKMDMTPCRESLLKKCMENDKLSHISQGIFAKVAMIVGENAQKEPVGIRGIIARDMPIEKVREKLGGASGAVVQHSAETTSQVDDILDDLVDA